MTQITRMLLLILGLFDAVAAANIGTPTPYPTIMTHFGPFTPRPTDPPRRPRMRTLNREIPGCSANNDWRSQLGYNCSLYHYNSLYFDWCDDLPDHDGNSFDVDDESARTQCPECMESCYADYIPTMSPTNREPTMQPTLGEGDVECFMDSQECKANEFCNIQYTWSGPPEGGYGVCRSCNLSCEDLYLNAGTEECNERCVISAPTKSPTKAPTTASPAVAPPDSPAPYPRLAIRECTIKGPLKK